MLICILQWQLRSSLIHSLLAYSDKISLFISTTPDLPGDCVFLDRVSGSIALKDY